MRHHIARALAVLAIFGAMNTPVHAGLEIFLYPIARMFGSPPEAELEKCRQALQKLQAQIQTSKVTLTPFYLVHDGKTDWSSGPIQELLQRASGLTTAQFDAMGAQPDVPHTPLGRNQLRYLWERASAYSEWVQANPQQGDYVWVTEVWSQADTVHAIHMYVFDRQGQVAYSLLMNSHHFGTNLHFSGDAVVKLLLDRFLDDMKVDPRKIYPPYGIG